MERFGDAKAKAPTAAVAAVPMDPAMKEKLEQRAKRFATPATAAVV